MKNFAFIALAYTTCISIYANTPQDHSYEVSSYITRAQAFQKEEKYEQAIEQYEYAFKQKQCPLQAYFNCALCCIMLGRSSRAIALYKTIFHYDPKNPSILYNMAYILKMEGMLDQAIPLYEKALELDPDREETHFGMGMAYLVKGDFKNGWRIHERFLKRTGRNAEKLRTFLQENTVSGKRILLRPEGGLGDTIQFLRYAKKLKELGAHVIVSVQKELTQLVSRCSYIDTLLKVGDAMNVTYDDTTTLMSMPAIWYTSHQEEIVTDTDYISPDPLLRIKWQTHLMQDHNFKIGICWGASVYNDASRAPVARRSIPLKLLYALHDIPGVSLYSLQRFDGEAELNDVPEHITIHTFGADFDSTSGPFMDSAAIIPHLDLVVCVDSATAHLAGALGKKVFLMLPYSTDWRWIAHRTDTPWYPSMHIFKQPKPFDWESVVHHVCTAIKQEMDTP